MKAKPAIYTSRKFDIVDAADGEFFAIDVRATVEKRGNRYAVFVRHETGHEEFDFVFFRHDSLLRSKTEACNLSCGDVKVRRRYISKAK